MGLVWLYLLRFCLGFSKLLFVVAKPLFVTRRLDRVGDTVMIFPKKTGSSDVPLLARWQADVSSSVRQQSVFILVSCPYPVA